MKRFLFFLTLPLLLLLGLTSCSENVNDEDTEYQDWKQRNEAFFREKMDIAKASVAAARAQYGEDWEAHCNYRIYRSFAVTDATAPAKVDSICVEIVERGTGSGSPQYTDSVDINYLRRLIPTEQYPQGRTIGHSGFTVKPEDIFAAQNAPTLGRRVNAITSVSTASGLTYGESTALQHMCIGDRWRIYIPARMAFGTNVTGVTPAHSTLISEIRLCAFYRAGYSVRPL